MPPLKREKEIRGFLGQLQYISQFIAKLTYTCEPIFKLLRNNEPHTWDDKCQKAFELIKCQHPASKSENCHWAFVRPPAMATLPRTHEGPLEAPLSRKWYCVVCACEVRGMVCTGLRVLSLSMKEGRSTFGVMAGIWAKF